MGYVVIYENGYKSWSPTEVFEAAYRPVSPMEREFVKGASHE